LWRPKDENTAVGQLLKKFPKSLAVPHIVAACTPQAPNQSIDRYEKP
jgi:hypothetical protein